MDKVNSLSELKLLLAKKSAMHIPNLVLIVGGFHCGKSTLVDALMKQERPGRFTSPSCRLFTYIKTGTGNGEPSFQLKVGQECIVSPDAIQDYLTDTYNDRTVSLTISRSKPHAFDTIVDTPPYCPEYEDEETLKLLHRADAIIFVLSATFLFTKDEEYWIKKHFDNRGLQNVFFAVNHMNFLRMRDQSIIKETVRSHLTQVFMDSNGIFNEELYKKRVFYIDAYKSKCCRTVGHTTVLLGRREVEVELDDADDQESGVPALEAAICDLLCYGNHIAKEIQK